jgi:hypothetical protein
MLHEPGCRDRRAIAGAVTACLCGGGIPAVHQQDPTPPSTAVQITAPPWDTKEPPHPEREIYAALPTRDGMTQAPPPRAAPPLVQQLRRPVRAPIPALRRARIRGTGMPPLG